MIVFRADANEHIATGHVMRCLAIAQELRKRGEPCIFVLAEEKGTEFITERGFPYAVLNSRWDCPEEELPAMRKFLQEVSTEVLVVDSYQAAPKYLKTLNSWVPVLYIDDMESFFCPVSMTLHYTNFPEDASYREKYLGSNTRVLSGMEFVPLREEFYSDYEEYEKRKPTGNILVTTGGTDPYHTACGLLKAVFMEEMNAALEPLKQMKYHVIVGKMNPDQEELRALEEKFENIKLFFHVSNMGEMMRASDLAVSAGGTTLFELCACGIPTVCFSFADNQKEFAKTMGNKGVMLYAGDPREEYGSIAENICSGLMKLKTDSVFAGQMAEKMRRLVDGKGAARIAEELLSLKNRILK